MIRRLQLSSSCKTFELTVERGDLHFGKIEEGDSFEVLFGETDTNDIINLLSPGKILHGNAALQKKTQQGFQQARGFGRTLLTTAQLAHMSLKCSMTRETYNEQLKICT